MVPRRRGHARHGRRPRQARRRGGERRRRLDEAKSSRFFSLLDRPPIAVDDETGGRAFGEIPHLCRAHNLSAHDAADLELAMRRGLPPACLDGKLRAAAAAVGVPPFAIA